MPPGLHTKVPQLEDFLPVEKIQLLKCRPAIYQQGSDLSSSPVFLHVHLCGGLDSTENLKHSFTFFFMMMSNGVSSVADELGWHRGISPMYQYPW